MFHLLLRGLGSRGGSGKVKNRTKQVSSALVCAFECWAFHIQTLEEMDIVCGEFVFVFGRP